MKQIGEIHGGTTFQCILSPLVAEAMKRYEAPGRC